MYRTIKLNQELPQGKPLPDSFQVCPSGEIRIKRKDSLWLDEVSAQRVIAKFQDQQTDMVVDYEHQTLDGGEAPAAGWITSLEWRGEQDNGGLWAKVQWNKKASEYISAREYRYISPVFLFAKSGRTVTELVNVAITNQPAMKDVLPLAAKERLRCKAEEGEEVEKTQETPTQEPPSNDLPEIAQALGLEEDSTLEDILAAISMLTDNAEQVGELTYQVETMTEDIARREADDMVQQALKDGKLTPFERDNYGFRMALKHPDMFKQSVLSRPKNSSVPLGKLGVIEEEQSSAVLSDTQRTINEQIGLKDSSYLKYKPQDME